jgi:hypothetical protein
MNPSLEPFPFLTPVKISSTGSTPVTKGSFKLDSRFIQGSIKVPFKVVFACNQGSSRFIKVKNFSANLENLDPLTRVSECPKPLQPQPNRQLHP